MDDGVRHTATCGDRRRGEQIGTMLVFEADDEMIVWDWIQAEPAIGAASISSVKCAFGTW